MRQGQQNRRGRNRNRKSHNPLTRSFESNGPDVKIRGTPSHIAEKYVSLARDALSSGDPVLAENYLQHAEHYNRIIMAYREQHGPGPDQLNGHRNRSQFDDQYDDAGGEDGRSYGDQPNIGGDPDQMDGGRTNGSANGHDYAEERRPASTTAEDFPDDSEQSGQRRASERSGDGDRRGRRPPRSRGGPQADRGSRNEGEDRSVDGAQPDFLKRPVRRPRRAASQNGEADVSEATSREFAQDEGGESA